MIQKSLLLALETTAETCSLALFKDEICIDQMSKLSSFQEGAASFLVPLTQELLEKNNATPKDLTHIAACRGPGAFTGIRVGLAAALGLSLCRDIPCLGVTTFEALRDDLPESAFPLLILRDTKCRSFYAAFYENPFDSPLLSVMEGPSSFLQRSSTILGDIVAAEQFPESVQFTSLSALHIGKTALKQLAQGKRPDATPFYLKLPNVTGPS